MDTGQQHDVLMRITMTLEPDVAERLQHQIRKTGQAMKAVVNDALRVGLGLAGSPEVEVEPFRVEPHDFGFREDIDLDGLNQLIDELEVEDFVREHGSKSSGRL